jgi:hypothetical protein
MIHHRRPSRGPTYPQAFSLVAAARVASAAPKRTVAAARPIYRVSRDDEERCAPSCKSRPLRKQRSFAVLKKVCGTHAKVELVAAVLFVLDYAVETKAISTLESSPDLFKVVR